MHSTTSYIKHIFAFQKGLQIQLHNESSWRRQQLQNKNLSVFLNDSNFIEPISIFCCWKINKQTDYNTLTTQ